MAINIINGRTGVLVPPASASALAQALGDIASGRVPARDLARGARALIEETYDSHVQAARLASLEDEEER